MTLPHKTTALIKSIRGWDWITVLEQTGDHSCIVEYNGKRLDAIFSTWIDSFIIYENIKGANA